MNSTCSDNDEIILATVIKPCPFCGNQAVIVGSASAQSFGLKCAGCSVGLTFPSDNLKAAVDLWTKRRGTVSAQGGRATRGLCTKRKRRSCRRNLRKARRALQAKRIREKVQAAWELVRIFRQIEWERVHESNEKSWAETQALEPKIRKYPDVARLYDWLAERRAANKEAGMYEMPASHNDILPEHLKQVRDYQNGENVILPIFKGKL